MTETAVEKVTEFQPPSIQSYSKRYPEYAHRFIDTNQNNRRGDRLKTFLSQVWEVAPYGNEGMKGNRDTGASSDDKAVHYRRLVLIRIPKHIADQRNKYYRGKHERLMQANQAMRELASRSAEANQQAGGPLASAFAQARQTKGRHVLHQSAADTAAPEKVLRDADPEAMRELKERMDQIQEENNKLRAEQARMREEAEERKARPSDRKRRSFPVS